MLPSAMKYWETCICAGDEAILCMAGALLPPLIYTGFVNIYGFCVKFVNLWRFGNRRLTFDPTFSSIHVGEFSTNHFNLKNIRKGAVYIERFRAVYRHIPAKQNFAL